MNPRVIVLVVLSAACVAASPLVGGSLDGAQGDYILQQLRIPRVLMAVLVGGTMGLVGACYQTIFANPLAAPSTVGTTAGATVGAMAAVVLGTPAWLEDFGFPVMALAAFIGALVVSFVISLIATSGRARVNDVLLAGIAMTLAAGAISTGLQYTADERQLQAAVLWSLGHLSQVGYRGVLMLLPFVVLCGAVLLLQARALNSLLGGEDRAHSQGVDVPRLRALVLGVGALAVAGCVAWCGPIAFVGLIVPHFVRLFVGTDRRRLLPLSFVAGAGFLAACDTVARLALPDRELPVGVLTAGLGAPLLVWLIASQRKS